LIRHVKYTIPVGICLALVYRPLLSRIGIYKVGFLIAVSYTLHCPWDSYLIRHKIWTYPPGAIVGPTLQDIPAEEVFFFFIQTFNTSLLYLILTKTTFHPIYLDRGHSSQGTIGQVILVIAILYGIAAVHNGGEGTYLGLILIWACPFLLLLWSLASDFFVHLPLTSTVIPILVPTLYLWMVDTFALRRGTWSISSGTKHGIELWRGLDIEEAIFFLLTNTMIVFGQVAFDNALAILDTFPERFRDYTGLPSPPLLIQTLLLPKAKYDKERIAGLVNATTLLCKKSRSFYLASGAFEGKLRMDLIRLYAFCRAADDLVDEATSVDEAKVWIDRLERFLQLAFGQKSSASELDDYVREQFPEPIQQALLQLPTDYLPSQPLHDLLKGFETDLLFATSFPIATTENLDLYASRVAGTVAELCNCLILWHYSPDISEESRSRIVNGGVQMGIALQYVNMARDIAVDAGIGRVYIPSTWLSELGLGPQYVVQAPSGSSVESLRRRLLDRAFAKYEFARGAIDELPPEVRGPIRVAVESYMEIGRVLREPGYSVRAGKATVPLWRRIRVAWSALSQ
ncbi:Squalene/phytoene synthase-domain-containing protein, partial [Fusarium solani]